MSGAAPPLIPIAISFPIFNIIYFLFFGIKSSYVFQQKYDICTYGFESAYHDEIINLIFEILA